MKKFSLVLFFTGILLLLSGGVLPILASSSISIIGGAVFPTYKYLFGGLPLVLVVLGGYSVVSALICILFPQFIKSNFSIKNTLIVMGISSSVALGLTCFFTWFSFAAFGERYLHPIAYPLSIVFGFTSLAVFALLVIIYFTGVAKNRFLKNLVFDIITSIVYLPLFAYVISFVIKLF